MYINFTSAVLSADGRTTEVIVPGIVQSWNDLAGYKKFEEFMCTLTDESIVDVGITVYGCDCNLAEVNGFASVLIRISRDYRLISDFCDEISHSAFKFAWSPTMQCGVDL